MDLRYEFEFADDPTNIDASIFRCVVTGHSSEGFRNGPRNAAVPFMVTAVTIDALVEAAKQKR